MFMDSPDVMASSPTYNVNNMVSVVMVMYVPLGHPLVTLGKEFVGGQIERFLDNYCYAHSNNHEIHKVSPWKSLIIIHFM